MPADAKRLSVLETKSVTRKTLEVHAAFVREFCDWTDSCVEALEVDRLFTDFMNLPAFFQRATGLGKAKQCRQASSSSFHLSRSWKGIDWLGDSEPSKDERRSLQVFRAGGCAHPGHVGSLSPTRGSAVTQTFEFPGTDGSWVILSFTQTGAARSKTGEADDTISLDSKRCLWVWPALGTIQRRQPQVKSLLNLKSPECVLLFRRAANW